MTENSLLFSENPKKDCILKSILHLLRVHFVDAIWPESSVQVEPWREWNLTAGLMAFVNRHLNIKVELWGQNKIRVMVPLPQRLIGPPLLSCYLFQSFFPVSHLPYLCAWLFVALCWIFVRVEQHNAQVEDHRNNICSVCSRDQGWPKALFISAASPPFSLHLFFSSSEKVLLFSA
jgi:hypothetical protein